MKKANLVLRFLLEWALICVGVLGSLYCLTTAFGFPMPLSVRIVVPVLALFFCLLFNGKIGKYYALGVLALLLFTLWLFREEVVEGFRSLWAVLIGIYNYAYNNIFSELLLQEETDPRAVASALVTLAVLETYLSALAVRLWKRTSPMALVLLLGIVPCFIVLDTQPNLLPLMAAVFAVLTLAFSQSARRRETGEQAKAIALSALLAGALLGVLLLIFPKESYSKPITWKELSEKVTKWHEQEVLDSSKGAGLSGNPDQIDLTALPSLPNQAVPTFYVTSSTKAYVYLRGSSYVGFDGSRWTRGALWNGGKSALFPYLGRTGGDKLLVETDSTEAVLFTTYQILDLPGGSVFADAYVENRDGLDRYSMYFTQEAGVAEPDADYEVWIKQHCLEVPARTKAGVLAWWEAVDGRSAPSPEIGTHQSGSTVVIDYEYMDPDSLEAFARSVAARVSQVAGYGRSPLRLPEGEDFCTWFLNEAEEGYCVHYATACTALLRSLGVPARYVWGYVCSLRANRRTQITNLQAHAWVEIWCGGRWIVIEPTPDNATEFTGNVNPVATAATEAPLPPPSESLTDPPPITKPKPSESTEAAQSESTEPGVSSDAAPGPGQVEQPKDLTALWVFLGAAGFLALVLGRRELAKRLRERRLRRARPNERGRLYYRYLRRLHKLAGTPVPPEVMELARKAAFSQYELSDEELASLRQMYDKQQSVLRYYSVWKRLWCEYVLAVI